MNIYLDSGFLDIRRILACKLPLIFVVGGRGTGKTYGALKYAKENHIKFVLLRRTQTQVDIVSNPDFQPFKKLNSDMGWNIGVKNIVKNLAGFYDFDSDDEQPIGYIMALSTISNVRGFDASDVKLIIYDEFIPERHERTIKNEGHALLNAYETINRNRELEGDAPVQLLALANANDLGNPVFMELKLIAKAERMRRNGQEYSLDAQKGIGMFILNESPISEAKESTALYKATQGSGFSAMALDNTFEELKSKSVKSRPLAEYKPIVTVGELTFYKHKSEGHYYASTHRMGNPPEYGTTETELQRFARAHRWVFEAYMKNKIIFEDATCEILLQKYLD